MISNNGNSNNDKSSNNDSNNDNNSNNNTFGAIDGDGLIDAPIGNSSNADHVDSVIDTDDEDDNDDATLRIEVSDLRCNIFYNIILIK